MRKIKFLIYKLVLVMTRKLKIIEHEGFSDYSTLLQEQLVYAQKIAEDKSHPYVLQFLEHKPVMTIGKTFESQHLLLNKQQLNAKGIEVIDVNRGGSVTYHGPGQLIVYCHIHLKEVGIFLDTYLRELEEWVQRTLSEYSIGNRREKGKTGVWTDKGKICAMGIAAKKFVTYHGLSINFNVDMKCFNYIIPCGLSEPVASMHQYDTPVSRKSLKETMLKQPPSWLENLELTTD